MVRRTKEQAAVTRNSILDAAENLFAKQGVARTTFHEIASAAGVTRGAVYWYFDDKAVLFEAMIKRATLPFEAELKLLDQSDSSRPLGELRDFILSTLRRTARDPQIQRVFEITTLKVELTEEMEPLVQRRRQSIDNWISLVGHRISLAKRQGIVADLVDEQCAARAMWIMVDGLIRTWMFDPTCFDIAEQGQRMIDTYLLGLQRKWQGYASTPAHGR